MCDVVDEEAPFEREDSARSQSSSMSSDGERGRF